MTGKPETGCPCLDELITRVLAIAPLPSLGHEEHRAASTLIQSLVAEIAGNGSFGPGFETLCAVATHLRTIGDSSAAEEIAAHSGDMFRSCGRPMSAVAMFNIAGLATLDQCAFPDADRYFSTALSLIPRSDPRFQAPAVLMNRAAVLTETDLFEDALAVLAKALRLIDRRARTPVAEMDSLVPDEIRGMLTNNTGWVLLRSARAAENDATRLGRAASAIKTALSMPLDPRTRILALGNRAEILVRSGRAHEAERVLAPLEIECTRPGLEPLLPEVYRRWAHVYAARREVPAAVHWARKAMQASLVAANPRQELRIVEVFIDILRDLVSDSSDPRRALESTGEPVVMQVLELLQSKDTYTGGNHSLRVSGLAGRIAARSAGDETTRIRRVRQIELAGLFHDFGKLLIPWCLLNKVSPLSERDWGILRSHTIRGEWLLDSMGLRDLARVAGGHHERPDGAGYPRGTRQATTEEAIVAVADAFEAMTSPSRIYARPKTVAEALAEVRRGSGSQFSPDVVEGLVSVFQSRS